MLGAIQLSATSGHQTDLLHCLCFQSVLKNRYDACKERQLYFSDTCFCYEMLLCFYLGPRPVTSIKFLYALYGEPLGVKTL